MTFHVLGIPYVATKKENSLCAFTIKVLQFCEQMTKRGHKVLFYGHKDSKVICSEHITVTNDQILALSYKNLDWKNQGFNQNVDTDAFKIFNQNCIREIKARISHENEFLCLFFGYGNLPVAEAFKNQLIVVEPSIGYTSMFAPIKIFETYSHMHAMHGAAKINVQLDTNFVVYPGFKQSDFIYKPQKQNYVLFLGRITSFKGANLVYDICNTNNQEAIFAGPNILDLKDTKYCKMIGFVEPKQRSELLANAKCLFAPSTFIEPCLWSIIEAQFSGTPTLGTDFGGPTETVKNGITGFRTNQTANFIKLLNRISEINPKDCLDNAIANFSIEKQMNNYEDIFVSLIS